MSWRANRFLTAVSLLGVSVLLCNALPVQEQQYKIEAFLKNGDSQQMVLRIQSLNGKTPSQNNRRGRQDDEDAPTTNNQGSNQQSSSAPFIPAVIPALTKLFTGIITGNLNEIVHGSTSFAPQNVSYAIDTVWNQVVGLPAPVSTPATTQQPSAIDLTPAPVTSAPVPPAVPSLSSVQDLQSQMSVLTSTESPSTSTKAASNEDDDDDSEGQQRAQEQSQVSTTTKVSVTSTIKVTSNEDDEDESEGEGIGFRRLKRKESSFHRQ